MNLRRLVKDIYKLYFITTDELELNAFYDIILIYFLSLNSVERMKFFKYMNAMIDSNTPKILLTHMAYLEQVRYAAGGY